MSLSVGSIRIDRRGVDCKDLESQIVLLQNLRNRMVTGSNEYEVISKTIAIIKKIKMYAVVLDWCEEE